MSLFFSMDKRLLGNAVLDNFEQDIGITPDQFNTCVTIFYVCGISQASVLLNHLSFRVGGLLDLSDTKQHTAQAIHSKEMVSAYRLQRKPKRKLKGHVQAASVDDLLGIRCLSSCRCQELSPVDDIALLFGFL